MLGRSLWQVVPRDHRQGTREFRRRQIVTLAFVVLGGGVLAFSLRIAPGSSVFYVATLVLAAIWAIGAFASGPIHLGRIAHGERVRRPVLEPIALGLLLAGIFVVGGLVVRHIGWLDHAVRTVLAHADQGIGLLVLLVTVLNGIAEELFFRGAVYAAIPSRPALWSTVLYVVATAATGNPMLAFAALVVGTVTALQRRASGGVLAPILTHCTWSIVLLYALPAIF
jgi:membrane protease YdiL (CAAX protease family)